VADARVIEATGRKRRVEVEVRRGEGQEGQEVIAVGEFLAVIPNRHVLDPPNPKEPPV
jgi:acyl-coenzyme A thioesterase PaaI-like protein